MELSILGSGFPMYFEFVLFSVIMVLMTFCISGIYNLLTSIQGKDCSLSAKTKSDMCVSNYVTKLSAGNKMYDLHTRNTQNYLNLVSIIVIVIFLQFVRKKQRKTARDVDANLKTPSDYTVVVKHLPKFADEGKIRSFFEYQAIPYDPECAVEKACVKRVNFAYDCREYIELKRRMINVIKELSTKNNKLKKSQGKNTLQEDEEILEKIDALQREKEIIEKRIKDFDSELGDPRKGRMHLGTAFVTFDKQTSEYQ
jgi:hypothetical protein